MTNKIVFLEKLKIALRSNFSKISSDPDIFAIGIFTDQDVTSFFVRYNTYTHFADKLKHFFLKYKRVVNNHKWLIPEWYDTLGESDPLFEELNNELYHKISEEEFALDAENYKDVILDLLQKALLDVKKEGLFDSFGENFILYLQQADSCIDDRMRQRIKELVNNKLYEIFMYDLNQPVSKSPFC